MAAKRRGAPPKSKKDKKDAHITCWMTDEQKELMVRAAESQGDAPGSWLRKAGESAARAQLGEGRDGTPVTPEKRGKTAVK